MFICWKNNKLRQKYLRLECHQRVIKVVITGVHVYWLTWQRNFNFLVLWRILILSTPFLNGKPQNTKLHVHQGCLLIKFNWLGRWLLSEIEIYILKTRLEFEETYKLIPYEWISVTFFKLTSLKCVDIILP